MRREAHELLERSVSTSTPAVKFATSTRRKEVRRDRRALLAVDAAFLILDEPTASLESRESGRLLALLERLRDAVTAHPW